MRRALLGTATAVLGGCSGGQILNGLVPTSTYSVRTGIGYGDHPRQRMDVYLPDPVVQDGPVVVFFYGGSWTRGERADYRFVGEALASAGVVTVVADYRLSPEVRWMQILEDCAAATARAFSLAPQWGGSRQRFYVMGHSAGAYNASMLALDPRWLRPHGIRPDQLAGWIGMAGPYDFLPIGDPDTRRAFDWPSTPKDSQPIHHVAPHAPRCLLLAARDDHTVDPMRNSGGLAQQLRQAGDAVDFEVFDRVSHTTIIAALAAPLRALAPARQKVLQFVGAPSLARP